MSGSARKRTLARLGVVAALVSLSLVGSSSAVDAASPAEKQMRSLINQERTERDKKPLAMSEPLVSVARQHSARMAEDGTIYHNPKAGTAVSFLNPSAWGENVGMGSSVSRVLDLFMKSAPHRKNILRASYDRIGVGVVSRDGTVYVTVMFVALGGSGTTSFAKTLAVGETSVPLGDVGSTPPSASPPSPEEPSAPPPPEAPPEPVPPDVTGDVQEAVDEVLQEAPDLADQVPAPVP